MSRGCSQDGQCQEQSLGTATGMAKEVPDAGQTQRQKMNYLHVTGKGMERCCHTRSEAAFTFNEGGAPGVGVHREKRRSHDTNALQFQNQKSQRTRNSRVTKLPMLAWVIIHYRQIITHPPPVHHRGCTSPQNPHHRKVPCAVQASQNEHHSGQAPVQFGVFWPPSAVD